VDQENFQVVILHQAEEDSPLPPPTNASVVQHAYSRRSDLAPS
jgi:hypothetical protein